VVAGNVVVGDEVVEGAAVTGLVVHGTTVACSGAEQATSNSRPRSVSRIVNP
jgi:hypothetical protein